MNELQPSSSPDPDILEALRLLGKTHLLLVIHDASFPGKPGEDCGCGSPYGKGALALAGFARRLGFTGLQLGPQGMTSPGNPSPYNGTLFSRSILSLDLQSLASSTWGSLLSEDTWKRIVQGNPRPDGDRVDYAYVHDAYATATQEIYRNFETARRQGNPEAMRLVDQLTRFWNDNRWIRQDAISEAMRVEFGEHTSRLWPQESPGDLDKLFADESAAVGEQHETPFIIKHGDLLKRYALIQFILLEQHRVFRDHMRELGLKLYGDVQVGFSLRDMWSRQSLLLRDYHMGAPPSRTNANGQPWSYQVLDPSLYLRADGGPGPVLDFIAERTGKMLSEFDGLRIDHPHGLVCPWVYKAGDPDPFRAVQNGARLFASPDLPDHPGLVPYAIVRPEQINRDKPRYADDWVQQLSPEQVQRYALVMDTVMHQVNAHGLDKEDILFEVLSTEPLPLRLVRLRHGLGRYRVTQKADLDNAGDVYRGENAQAQDWIMVGNHDTPPVWRLAKEWQGRKEGHRQAAYLAGRLCPHAPESLAAALAADYRKLAHAKVADLFLSPARHVMVFLSDLFGLEDVYNSPGTVNDDNWTLRLPPDFASRHEYDRQRGEALNLHAVLALALRAHPQIVGARPELIARLEASAGWRIDW